MNSLTILAVLAVVIVLVLAGVAIYYLLRVRKMEQERQQQLDAMAEERAAQRLRLIKSIQLIARGMLDDQLTLTEGAIRIKVMLDGLAVEEDTRQAYVAFYHLAAATDHIPILGEWKKLSTKQKLQFDSQREQLERDHREFVLDAAKRILVAKF
ncbi:DUF2489 domain-containing protein [Pseudomaricurvus alcaniphilus]|uniref:DUF2489 domain-containing protein n=1 Tax=Pseudomaricurvus alcaniphilus TaxID=1166482 RepID=UPI00140E5F87|nr:DUF2489 domain-containing protein [Pseudomaricurvus alcaniphilus]NHN39314.1 DUF2489 domain-containing protein [Pseudomaricurvus alcaniphilus]